MAVFSSQTLSLDPTLPNPETLKEIFDILLIDPNSVLLETKITDLGFSRNAVDKLRKDSQFFLHTVETLQKKLKKLRKEHFNVVTEAYNNWVAKGIVNDSLNLFEKMLISQQPGIIKRLEYKWLLPRTGDFDSMVENYRRKKYTRQCLYFEHSPNFCMIGATYWGHLDIIKRELDRGADNYNQTMSSAAWGGRKEIVQMMLNLGADDYNDAITQAAYGGHKEIIQMMLDLGANDYNKTMNFAASSGHIEIIQMMLDLGADDYNITMCLAAEGGHKEIVKMMLGLGANNYNDAMISATWGGQKEIVEMMLDLGANAYNDAMITADAVGHKEIVQMMSDKNVNNYIDF